MFACPFLGSLSSPQSTAGEEWGQLLCDHTVCDMYTQYWLYIWHVYRSNWLTITGWSWWRPLSTSSTNATGCSIKLVSLQARVNSHTIVSGASCVHIAIPRAFKCSTVNNYAWYVEFIVMHVAWFCLYPLAQALLFYACKPWRKPGQHAHWLTLAYWRRLWGPPSICLTFPIAWTIQCVADITAVSSHTLKGCARGRVHSSISGIW